MEAKTSVKLKVAEAYQNDLGKSIVRIDSDTMKSIGIAPGNFVEIIGKKSTVALADRALPADIGLKLIRMDGYLRRNAGVGVGEVVIIRKTNCKEAESVTLAPAQEGINIRVNDELIKQNLMGRPMVKGDIVTLGFKRDRRFSNSFFDDMFKMIMDDDRFFPGFGSGELKLVAVKVKPRGPVAVTKKTRIEISTEAAAHIEKIPDITYEDIGGLDDEIKKVREMVELPLRNPEIFETLGIQPPKGVLLYGPPGTGKTLLAKAVANESEANFMPIVGSQIMSKWVGEAEKRIRELFDKAEKNAPSIIFIDEIDSIAPKREEVTGEVERRVVAQLLASMDGLKSRGKVIVIGATNRQNALDPALRRPGRFDREIELGVPDKKGREKILRIHTRHMPLYNAEDAIKELDIDDNQKMILIEAIKKTPVDSKPEVMNSLKKVLKDKGEKLSVKHYNLMSEALKKIERVDVKQLAQITHGFVGADLEALCKEAAMNVLRRVLPEFKLKEGERVPKEILEKLKVTASDFKEALKLVRPSAMREVLIEIPNIKWGDVGGLENVKSELKEIVEWPLKFPDSFKRMGIKAPRGILMFGPPGCGKTLLAKAVANEAEANFISVKGPSIFSKWVGESEKAIREIFRKARMVSPAIIFFDEIDSLAPKRTGGDTSKVYEQVVNQLLTEMDGLEELSDVVVIAATNRPDIIDSALLRPGRFDRIIVVPQPDKATRQKVLEVHTRGMPLNKDINIIKLAEVTEGYSGADLHAICREAAMSALREDINSSIINRKHFEDALNVVKPSLTKSDTALYHRFADRAKAVKISSDDLGAYMG